MHKGYVLLGTVVAGLGLMATTTTASAKTKHYQNFPKALRGTWYAKDYHWGKAHHVSTLQLHVDKKGYVALGDGDSQRINIKGAYKLNYIYKKNKNTWVLPAKKSLGFWNTEMKLTTVKGKKVLTYQPTFTKNAKPISGKFYRQRPAVTKPKHVLTVPKAVRGTWLSSTIDTSTGTPFNGGSLLQINKYSYWNNALVSLKQLKNGKWSKPTAKDKLFGNYAATNITAVNQKETKFLKQPELKVTHQNGQYAFKFYGHNPMNNLTLKKVHHNGQLALKEVQGLERGTYYYQVK